MNRIGASTWSKRPFEPQFRESARAGYDGAELDVAHLAGVTPALVREAKALAGILPIDTVHLPSSQFDDADAGRFRAFVDALIPVGVRVFNMHLAPARKAGDAPMARRIAWIDRLCRHMQASGAVLTVENLDEPLQPFVEAFASVPDLRFCLDVGHANLDHGTTAAMLLGALGNRLGLLHVHDNAGGHGKAGDKHLPIGRGRIDFEPVFARLREMRYDGPVTLEIFTGTREDHEASVAAVRRMLVG